ncbi:ParB/RepB/Spo0J family partition protein, partial [Pontiellaceae bacterium B1224]|nr:ParB/RepB/Spo0J family partition protein [Pontiellaceae bacterium B1224]
MAAKRKGLGRGLDALIKDGSTAKAKAVTKKAPVKAMPTAAPDSGGVREVPVSKVVASPWQPRSVFDSEALTELVESVKVHGVLQPLLVRTVGTKFELIAGERRLRAAQAAMLTKVPVIVIEATDEKALEIAL